MSRYLFEARHQSGRLIAGLAEASSEDVLQKELAISSCVLLSARILPDAPPANLHLSARRPSAYYCMAWEDMRSQPDWMHYMELHHDEHHLTATGRLKDEKVDYCAFLPLLLPGSQATTEPPDGIMVDRERSLVHLRSPVKSAALRKESKRQVLGWVFLLIWLAGFTFALYMSTHLRITMLLPVIIAFIVLITHSYSTIHSRTIMDLNAGRIRRGLKTRIPLLSREWSMEGIDRLVVHVSYCETSSGTIKSPRGTRRLDPHLLIEYSVGLGRGEGIIPLFKFQHRLEFNRYGGVSYPEFRKRLMAHPLEVRQALKLIGDLLHVDVIEIESGRTRIFTTLSPDGALNGYIPEEVTAQEEPIENEKIPASNIAEFLAIGLVWNSLLVWIYSAMLYQLSTGNMTALLLLLFLTPFLGFGLAATLSPLLLAALNKLRLIPSGIKPDWRRTISVKGHSIAFWGGLFHLVIGIWLMAAHLPPIVSGYWEMRRWQPVPCEIVSIRLVEIPREPEPLYDIEVSYLYRAGDREQVGRSLMMNWEPSPLLTMIEAQLDQYTSGSQSTCFVEPGNPERAVLNRQMFGPRRVLAFFGSFLVLFGAVIMGIGGRLWIKANRPASNPMERPERVLTWLSVFIGWMGLGISLFISDILYGRSGMPDQGIEELSASAARDALNRKIALFFAIAAALILFRLLYHIFVKWNRVLVISGSDFHAMHEQALREKKRRSPSRRGR